MDRKNIPHVVRWFLTCVNQMKAFGEHKLCAAEAQFDAKTFGELNKKSGGKKDDKKQEKKAEKKKEAPKPKDPWAGLGGDYDMDAWKRMYSNNDTVPTAVDYFWENSTKKTIPVISATTNMEMKSLCHSWLPISSVVSINVSIKCVNILSLQWLFSVVSKKAILLFLAFGSGKVKV